LFSFSYYLNIFKITGKKVDKIHKERIAIKITASMSKSFFIFLY